MKLLKSIRVNLFCICLLSCLMVSCESGSDNDGPSLPGYENTTVSVAGTWSGKSATGQVPSTLRLTESNGRISGQLKWPNDSRTISGSHNNERVQLNVGGGDRWTLTFSGRDTLRGTGVKPNGNTYNLFFERR